MSFWSRVATAVLLGVFMLSCCMAGKASKADDECSKLGGHLEGIFAMECVIDAP